MNIKVQAMYQKIYAITNQLVTLTDEIVYHPQKYVAEGAYFDIGVVAQCIGYKNVASMKQSQNEVAQVLLGMRKQVSAINVFFKKQRAKQCYFFDSVNQSISDLREQVGVDLINYVLKFQYCETLTLMTVIKFTTLYNELMQAIADAEMMYLVEKVAYA